MSDNPTLISPGPFELGVGVAGVRLFHGLVQPGIFAEHAHPEIEIDMPLGEALVHSEWHTPTGSRLRGRGYHGAVSLVPSGLPHAGVWERLAPILVVFLDPAALVRVAADQLKHDDVALTGAVTTDDPLLTQLLLALRVEAAAPGGLHPLYVEAWAGVLGVHLLRRYGVHAQLGALPERQDAQELFRPARDYIDVHLGATLTLAELAATVALSPYHFCRRFKQTFGVSPYQYVLRRRVERARTLLEQTCLPLAAVAQAVGFTSATQLHRHVVQQLGCTPGSLRRARIESGSRKK